MIYFKILISGNSGCSGGNTDNTYRYIYYNQGIDSERVYPYQAEVFYY